MKCTTVLRMVFTWLFAVAILAGMIAVYSYGFQFVSTPDNYLSFGLYGAVLAIHLIIQSVFAFLEHLKMKRSSNFPPCQGKSVALMIAAYQEDPVLLQKCLESVRDIDYENLKVIMVIDGNSDDDMYMRDQFVDVFGAENSDTFVWRHNYHHTEPLPENVPGLQFGAKHLEKLTVPSQRDNGGQLVQDIIRNNRYSCIMQKWGGKREVMYTAFRALGDTVDYIQVCDSDTILDAQCTTVMAKVLDNDRSVGAVGGDVRIWNHSDSWISFLSGLRYWMAFNIERACQSYFNVVSCISGPLGFYRNDLLQSFLEDWYNQTFLGKHCTFGDDRHLTNRMLSIGYGTKYTARSFCYTETPAQYLRWLNQQTRWTKSYFREWLYNAMWFHKHHLWMTYESIIAGLFPFFVTVTVIRLFYTGLWNIVLILLTIQLVGLVKALYACILRRNPIMIFMSVYSMLYMTSLLPAKYWAILTINKNGWGTSGRKKIVTNFIPLVPLIAWFLILGSGFGYSLYLEVERHRNGVDISRLMYIGIGLGIYAFYWLLIFIFFTWRHCKFSRLRNGYDFEQKEIEAAKSSAVSQNYTPNRRSVFMLYDNVPLYNKTSPPALDLREISVFSPTRRPSLVPVSPDYESGVLTGVPQFVYPDTKQTRKASLKRRTSIERWESRAEPSVLKSPKSPTSPTSPAPLPTLSEVVVQPSNNPPVVASAPPSNVPVVASSPDYEHDVLTGAGRFSFRSSKKQGVVATSEERWDRTEQEGDQLNRVTSIPGRAHQSNPSIVHDTNYVEHGYQFKQ
ncbi:hyaluronan synthase 2-like [Branchiostoma floridae]|uniref:Hyaluronan synthase 2-like n=2 Tax=Branchiostoma floridae TaxID=7739 RepID=A0A9J7M1P9_BRAFL|nr:hyaluronan synthase 2-like [Branchiostoma floridae]XP_035693132.1 hyaluronan synthase 2-like [Branchiostoma floridae]